LPPFFLLTGFISDYEKPMEASSRLVEEILARFGFDQLIYESTKGLNTNSFFKSSANLCQDNILHDASV